MDFQRLSLAFEVPRLLRPPSGWLEHVPLAMVLVQLLRPQRVVELGTHHGISYCALCQAVATLRLNCQCTAIDTWRGDAQAGVYGPEVLQRLRSHHDSLYGSFSQLRRSRFDRALPDFALAAVDFLHFDGLHTHHAVRDDWESWRSRVSARGIVLFHDTQVRRRDFGVWKLWAELSARYPSFEFLHSHGLGILAVGEGVCPEVAAFLEWCHASPDRARGMFATLGRVLTLAREGDALLQHAPQRLPNWRWRALAGLAAVQRAWAEYPETREPGRLTAVLDQYVRGWRTAAPAPKGTRWGLHWRERVAEYFCARGWIEAAGGD